MFAKLKPYNKFIVALLGAILTVVAQFYGSNPYVAMILSVLAALGVFVIPNKKVAD